MAHGLLITANAQEVLLLLLWISCADVGAEWGATEWDSCLWKWNWQPLLGCAVVLSCYTMIHTFVCVATRSVINCQTLFSLLIFYSKIFTGFNRRVDTAIDKGCFYNPWGPAQNNPYFYYSLHLQQQGSLQRWEQRGSRCSRWGQVEHFSLSGAIFLIIH